MARWVQIRRYHLREGVLVERSVLESAGILVFVPDLEFYCLFPHIADASRQGYCLFVLDDDVEDARAILNLRDDSQTCYPSPTTGGKSRRLKNITATILLSILMTLYTDALLAPVRRRRRIDVETGERFTPEPPEPFTAEELGYTPEPPGGLTLMERFLRFKRWTRSVGYDSDIAFEDRRSPKDKREEQDDP